jgi:hypothetical protein
MMLWESIGIHKKGLKIPRGLPPYEFDSRPRHHIKSGGLAALT